MRKTMVFWMWKTIFIVADIGFAMQAQRQSFILPKCFSIVLKTDIWYFMQSSALIISPRCLLFVTVWLPADLWQNQWWNEFLWYLHLKGKIALSDGIGRTWKFIFFRSLYILLYCSGSTVLKSLCLGIKIQACLPWFHDCPCKVKHFSVSSLLFLHRVFLVGLLFLPAIAACLIPAQPLFMWVLPFPRLLIYCLW